MTAIDLSKYSHMLTRCEPIKYYGRVSQVIGLTIESVGPSVKIGEICYIYTFKDSVPLMAEVVGFKEKKVLLMPLGDMEGIGPGSKVEATGSSLKVKVGSHLLGRVLDGLGKPLDGNSPIQSSVSYQVMGHPLNPLERTKIETPLPLGVRCIDALLTCGTGQRIGIFSGSGVGKSTLLGMIARNTQADVNVIALIGERGREVREFMDNDLQEEGLRRSVVIVATSDQPPLIRMKGALLASAVAEYYRDQGLNVMLMMDSITRFSMAQREIGLAIGEPPVTKGYTPSVFAILPKLLERSGTSSKGSITGLYTVLVDGDDLNEPIADAVRGILDGHIVLSRKLANRTHYPAIDVLGSLSRVMPNIVSKEHVQQANKIKEVLSTYQEAEDLISIGAYARGSNRKIDFAIDRIETINGFLQQDVNEKASFHETISEMNALLE